jgi:hypothetical protein
LAEETALQTVLQTVLEYCPFRSSMDPHPESAILRARVPAKLLESILVPELVPELADSLVPGSAQPNTRNSSKTGSAQPIHLKLVVAPEPVLE